MDWIVKEMKKELSEACEVFDETYDELAACAVELTTCVVVVTAGVVVVTAGVVVAAADVGEVEAGVEGDAYVEEKSYWVEKVGEYSELNDEACDRVIEKTYMEVLYNANYY